MLMVEIGSWTRDSGIFWIFTSMPFWHWNGNLIFFQVFLRILKILPTLKIQLKIDEKKIKFPSRPQLFVLMLYNNCIHVIWINIIEILGKESDFSDEFFQFSRFVLRFFGSLLRTSRNHFWTRRLHR
jgi:hypothetical protein